jgi:hypothetical protein
VSDEYQSPFLDADQSAADDRYVDEDKIIRFIPRLSETAKTPDETSGCWRLS